MQDRTSTFRSGFAKLWNVIPAWSATLLFGFQPVAQLVRTTLTYFSCISCLLLTCIARLSCPAAEDGFVDPAAGLESIPNHMWLVQASNMANPANLAGVSAMSLLLGTSGNALMAPRALHVRDPVWLAGSSWGSVMGLGSAGNPLHGSLTIWVCPPPSLPLAALWL